MSPEAFFLGKSRQSSGGSSYFFSGTAFAAISFSISARAFSTSEEAIFSGASSFFSFSAAVLSSSTLFSSVDCAFVLTFFLLKSSSSGGAFLTGASSKLSSKSIFKGSSIGATSCFLGGTAFILTPFSPFSKILASFLKILSSPISGLAFSSESGTSSGNSSGAFVFFLFSRRSAFFCFRSEISEETVSIDSLISSALSPAYSATASAGVLKERKSFTRVVPVKSIKRIIRRKMSINPAASLLPAEIRSGTPPNKAP